MQHILHFKTLILTLSLAFFLVACDSAEERAEEYFQSGLSLIEQGDYDRAMVEFRNVFELNSSHQEARRKLAEILLLQKSNPLGAYRQYLRLAEQYPEDADARINLSELAFAANNWEEFERHGTTVQELEPDSTRAKAIAIALAYRQALLDEDNTAIREQARRSEALQPELPENIILRRVALDTQVRDGDLQGAIASLDWFIAEEPDNMLYWRQRLTLLAQIQDMEAVEAQLQDMIARFPDNLENKQMLLRFYLERNRVDDAETFMRAQAEQADDNGGARVDLVTFLLQARGPEAAREELEQAIVEEVNPDRFRILRAGLDFQSGERDAAVAELENILSADSVDPDIKQATLIALARMLIAMGNDVGAQQRVADLLTEDPSNPEGLKMQAVWQIEGDDPDTAINSLRSALDRAPDDAQAMTLMAQAYTLTGRNELAKEFLALAVEASGNAPVETLRYVRRLISEKSFLPAEDLLQAALRLAPQNIDLLASIGQLYLRMEDIGRVEQVIRTLERLETPQARALAQGLETERLNQESGSEQALSYLEELAESEDAGIREKINLIRAQLQTEDRDDALNGAQELLIEDPENPSLRALVALTQQANGNLEEAASIYRDLLTENPQLLNIWVQLAQLERITVGPDAASAIIDEGLQTSPDAALLLVESAVLKEFAGDIDGALEIYEGLYARNSGSFLLANNLASLLATYRSNDAASVERAWTVARRLRDSNVPAIQDTYGWILHLRGEHADALPYLEAAAEGVPNDPIVQFHLAQVYSALDRPKDALRQYRRAVDVAGPADQRDQINLALERIAELQAAPISGESTPQEN